MNTTIIFQAQSITIVILLFIGLYFKNKPKIHVKIMSTAIIWDLLLVLQIELDRSAINKATKIVENSLLLNIHVAIAITTVLLYFVVFYFGLKVLKGNRALLPIHKKIGLLTLSLRVIILFTSMIIKK